MKNLYLISLLLFIACSDVFEEDLSESDLILKSPYNGVVTDLFKQTFWWDFVKGADFYELQIASPSFSQITNLVLDTIIEKNNFSFTLEPGKFEWCVVGFNYSSACFSDTFAITIDSIANISNQEIVIIEPKSKFINNRQVLLQWEELSIAESYRIEIRRGSWENGNVDSSFYTISSSITLNLNEGAYSIGVQGELNDNFTKFSIKDVVIDLTEPEQPLLILPEDQAVIKDTVVEFNWTNFDNISSKLYDTIFVSETSEFPISSSNKFGTSESNISITFGTNGKYYWKVVTHDAAGNQSTFSEIRSFTIDKTN